MAKTNKTPKAEDNAELRTISLLKILNTYSDENHELSTKNIMDKLQKECGVTVHRTTVGKNIKQHLQAPCRLRAHCPHPRTYTPSAA